jgi:DNA-binding response OmpR family regulator
MIAKVSLEDSFEVVVASSKKEGMEKVRRETPDLIILGYLEPRGTSFGFHKELRSDQATREVPLLVVDVSPDAHSQKGWKRDEGLQMEAHDYISRPVEPATLRKAVESILCRTGTKPLEIAEVLDRMVELLRRVDTIEKQLTR